MTVTILHWDELKLWKEW